jgi:hypothetical protein
MEPANKSYDEEKERASVILHLFRTLLQDNNPQYNPPHSLTTTMSFPRAENVGILGIEMYFPKRVRYTPCARSLRRRRVGQANEVTTVPSASRRRSWRSLMVSQRESTRLGLGSSTWLALMIGEWRWAGRFYACGMDWVDWCGRCTRVFFSFMGRGVGWCLRAWRGNRCWTKMEATLTPCRCKIRFIWSVGNSFSLTGALST